LLYTTPSPLFIAELSSAKEAGFFCAGCVNGSVTESDSCGLRMTLYSTIILLGLTLLTNNVSGQDARKVVVEGFVRDAQTLEFLIGADIALDGVSVASTNQRGYFTFTSRSGSHVVEARMLGYGRERKTLLIDKNHSELSLFFDLSVETIPLEGVLVIGEHQSRLYVFKKFRTICGLS
jgi:CarboxypepD_reg-like domain